MKLYLVRHGQTRCNAESKFNGRLDEDINERGIEQAKQTREIIKELDIDLIFCSPLKRTRHTCEIINSKHLPVIFDDRLKERDCGELSGCDLGEFYKTNFWNLNYKIEIEGLESIPSLFNRVREFIEEIKVKYKDKNILIVAHGGISKAVYYYFNPLPKDGMVNKIRTHNCEVKEYTL